MEHKGVRTSTGTMRKACSLIFGGGYLSAREGVADISSKKYTIQIRLKGEGGKV